MSSIYRCIDKLASLEKSNKLTAAQKQFIKNLKLPDLISSFDIDKLEKLQADLQNELDNAPYFNFQ